MAKHKIIKNLDDMHKYVLGSMILVIVLLIILLVQVVAIKNQVMTISGDTYAKPTEVAQKPTTQPTTAPTKNKVDMAALMDDDPVKGDPNAPVTIVEWSDFECPYCGRFYSQTLSQIEEEYINTGKVKLVYRDFPLSFHPQAQKAAEAAECAKDQGKFWEMHDKLFGSGVQGGVATFKTYAVEIGLNTETFNTCLDSGKKITEIQKDLAAGSAAGIRGTPGFIINGQLVSGAQPFANFKKVIDAALAE